IYIVGAPPPAIFPHARSSEGKASEGAPLELPLDLGEREARVGLPCRQPPSRRGHQKVLAGEEPLLELP
ncbi:hypothetical protein CRG98_028821, partial [Punica granatum]